MELRRKSDDRLPAEEPRSELSDPLEAAAILVASGDHEGAVALLKPFVLQQLSAGDLSFRLQVPGIYPSIRADHWSEAIAERIVGNLESLNSTLDQSLREAESDEDEEHATTWMTRALLLMAGLESVNLFREGENDAFQRSARRDVWKVWVHTGEGKEPRTKHQSMNGEAVHCIIGEDTFFSLGCRWPEDVKYLPAEEVVNCHCRVNYRTVVEVPDSF